MDVGTHTISYQCYLLKLILYRPLTVLKMYRYAKIAANKLRLGVYIDSFLDLYFDIITVREHI